VLFYWPAALTGMSAVNLSGQVIHVAIARERTGARVPGVRLHRLAGLGERVQWNLSPPRVRFEDALLMLCEAAPTRSQAPALAADACQRRRTTPARLRAALLGRARMRDRKWMLGVLTDLQAGVRSVLEAAYLRKVERAHGLPPGRRQPMERTADGVVYRDVVYDAFAMVVELDGRLGHELSQDRWDDMDRDLLAAADAVLTLRLGWRHAEDRPCQTAERLGRVFASRGWAGRPIACGPQCLLSVGSHPHAG